MHILYHHRTLADGAEGIHIQELVEAFELLGHKVSIHALASPKSRGVGKTSAWARLKAMLPPVLFEMAALAYNVVDYVRMRAVIRNCTPDLVYKRHALYDIGVILATRAAGVPLILEANGAFSSPQYLRFEPLTFERLARWCERVCVDGATLVAAVSTPMASYLRSLSKANSHVIVVPNGANPERFRASPEGRAEVRQRYNIAGRIVIGWTGILREWHRVDLLLEAAARIPESRVLIVGDGPDRQRLETRAAALGISDRLHITGRVPHMDMPTHVAAFDIAVAAHDGTGHASPMKLLEYMATSLPVVAPRMPNIEDLVCDGVDGVLFTPGDSHSLTATLRRLINDPEMRRKLGQGAREKIERERNWTRNAEHMLEEVRRRWPSAQNATSSLRRGARRNS